MQTHAQALEVSISPEAMQSAVRAEAQKLANAEGKSNAEMETVISDQMVRMYHSTAVHTRAPLYW